MFKIWKKKNSYSLIKVISIQDKITNAIPLANNYIAIKLYENMNFKIINIRKKYYNDIDAYVMERN